MTIVKGKNNKLDTTNKIFNPLYENMSQDKQRHAEEQKHHPNKDVYPHPPHHQHPQPNHKTLIPYHNPHEIPPEYKLNIDHGTHTDRPKPYKSMIKNGKAGKKFD